MPRPRKTIPAVYVNVALPEDLAARMKLMLFSDLEGKIPHGAQSEFIAGLVKKYFEHLEGVQHAAAN